MKKKQIVIIESSPTDTLAKIAKALRKKGYETVFITLIGDIETDFIKESYDKVISFNAKFFKINLSNLPKIFLYGLKNISSIIKALIEIKKLKPYIIIGRGPPNWLCTLYSIYFKNRPFVYFPYDIRSFSYKTIKQALSLGIPKFEIKAERYCFKNADGIIHKGNEDELKHLNKKILGDIQIKSPSIYFFPYCLKEFMLPINKKNKLSHKDKNTHLVYVGHVSSDKDWIDGLKKIINQKIYLHLYSRTNNITKEEEKKRVSNLLGKSLLKNKFLVIHEAVSQKDLSKEISKYDYGLYSYCYKAKRGYANATGNKIASYLEAGLPIISPSCYTSANKVLRNQGVGILPTNSEFENIKRILNKNKPEKFEKNILKTREEFSMESQILRLENFFRESIAYKKINKRLKFFKNSSKNEC